MKLEVTQPKTKNNMNFQPEETITDQSATLIVNFFVKSKDCGRGGGGLFERGRGLDRGFTVYIKKRTLSSAKNILKQIIHI